MSYSGLHALLDVLSVHCLPLFSQILAHSLKIKIGLQCSSFRQPQTYVFFSLLQLVSLLATVSPVDDRGSVDSIVLTTKGRLDSFAWLCPPLLNSAALSCSHTISGVMGHT